MRRRDVLIGAGAGALALAGGAATYVSTATPDYARAVAPLRRPRAARGPRDLEYLVQYARLAANGHNTQPWTFAETPGGVAIRPDLSRATPVVDPDDHHLYVSLGCAAENLLLAASAAGAAGALSFEAEGEGRLLVDVAEADPVRSDLFDAILLRQSTRSDYAGGAVPAATLAALENASAMGGCDIALLTAKPELTQLEELIVAANDRQVANPAFVKELAQWMRFNPRSAIASGDGLYTGSTGNPRLPSWLGRALFPHVFTPDAEREKIIGQVRSTSGFAIFFADRSDPAHWVQVGRSFERFALKATALGLRLALLNQPVEEPAFRADLAALAGATGKRPDLVVRFGHAAPLPMSFRRPIADVVLPA